MRRLIANRTMRVLGGSVLAVLIAAGAAMGWLGKDGAAKAATKSSKQVESIAMAPMNDRYLVAVSSNTTTGNSERILTSTDGARTWSATALPASGWGSDIQTVAVLGSGATLVAIDGDQNNGPSAVIQSTDGGKTWRPGLRIAEFGRVYADPASATTAWLCVPNTTDGRNGLFVSVDSGRTWTRRGPNRGCFGFAAKPTSRLLI